MWRLCGVPRPKTIIPKRLALKSSCERTYAVEKAIVAITDEIMRRETEIQSYFQCSELREPLCQNSGGVESHMDHSGTTIQFQNHKAATNRVPGGKHARTAEDFREARKGNKINNDNSGAPQFWQIARWEFDENTLSLVGYGCLNGCGC